MSSVYVGNFRSLGPKYRVQQSDALAWLREAHVHAEFVTLARRGIELDVIAFREIVGQALKRYGCGEQQIARRGSQNLDFTHTNWDDMEIYRISESPRGLGAASRNAFFEKEVDLIFERLLEPMQNPPTDAIHVTCTGYSSPSVAQRFVSGRGWGEVTRVTHAYHMGCYAAFPALRIAAGLAESRSTLRDRQSAAVEIVHTEFCTLHLNPLDHTPEQLVVQSLFADGFIAYSVASKNAAWPGFEILAAHEVIVPDSEQSMRWICSDWGMQMTLARDVPARLIGTLEPFVRELLARANLPEKQQEKACFAVHPGGPKILIGAARLLGLADEQVAHSKSILFQCGNMSSATIPHIWQAILEDRNVPNGQVVVSLAFGPGLTICGAVMRKLAA